MLILVLSFLLLWFTAWASGKVSQRRHDLSEEMRPDFNVILAASLTLLYADHRVQLFDGTSRYDMRKTYEEAEANAIGLSMSGQICWDRRRRRRLKRLFAAVHGTAYTGLLDTRLQHTLRDDLTRINRQTAQIQDQLWVAASQAAMAQPTPVRALAVAGMNDVLNSQGYTQAAWWNRIPVGRGALMFGIAVFCIVRCGYGAHQVG